MPKMFDLINEIILGCRTCEQINQYPTSRVVVSIIPRLESDVFVTVFIDLIVELPRTPRGNVNRSEEHTSELQSL